MMRATLLSVLTLAGPLRALELPLPVMKRPPSPAAALTRAELEAEPVPDGERYYVLLFGSESVPKRAVLTHTWCTLVRAPAPGGAIETHTISWMPRTLAIRPFRLSVEPGVNLDLSATMALVTGQGQRVTLYGPYEVRPSLYRRLRLQREFLMGGSVGYQGFDLIGEAGRRGNGSNCIHALTDADPRFGRASYLSCGNGGYSTDFIRNRMVRRGAILDPDTTHDWMLPALGLDPAALRRR